MTRRPRTRSGGVGGVCVVDLNGPKDLRLVPGRLAALVHLERDEDGHGLARPVLATEGIVEVEWGAPLEELTQDAKAPFERDRRADMRGVRCLGHSQQAADGLGKALAYVHGAGRLERDAAEFRRQRSRAEVPV